MASGTWFFIASGMWAVAMIAVFIQAIRLSYRIEERSPQLRNRTGLPRYAAIPFTATNRKVAQDAETQGLRRRMILMLGLNVLGFLLLAAILALTPGG